MKNLALLSIFILFVFSSLQAQLEKGSMLIGGNAGFRGSITSSNQFYNFSLQPNMGFFVIKKLAIGSSIGFYGQGERNFQGGKYSSIGIGISPFARYYFLKSENKFNLFANVGLGFYQNWTLNLDINSTRFDVTPNSSVGLVYFLRPQIALEARINAGYSYSNFGWTTFGVQVNSSIGFQIHLNKIREDAK